MVDFALDGFDDVVADDLVAVEDDEEDAETLDEGVVLEANEDDGFDKMAGKVSRLCNDPDAVMADDANADKDVADDDDDDEFEVAEATRADRAA